MMALAYRPCDAARRPGGGVRRLGIGFLAVAAASCAGGGEPRRSLRFDASAPPYALLFSAYDQDGDGITTAAEREAGASASWALAAGNNDAIRALAFQDWAEKAVGSRDVAPGFLTFDQNRDDQVRREEFEAGLTRVFKTFDQDGDGALNRSEMLREGRPLGPTGAPPPQQRRRR